MFPLVQTDKMFRPGAKMSTHLPRLLHSSTAKKSAGPIDRFDVPDGSGLT